MNVSERKNKKKNNNKDLLVAFRKVLENVSQLDVTAVQHPTVRPAYKHGDDFFFTCFLLHL